MFGWEFPPHIAGGLGTACYGMTRGLARNGVDVTFIVPHAYGDEDQRFTHVVNASDVEAMYGSTGSGADDILEKMSFIHIDSNMVPYISPEEYESYHEQYVKSGREDLVDDRRLETALHLSRASTAPTSWRRWRATPWSPRRWPRTSKGSST